MHHVMYLTLSVMVTEPGCMLMLMEGGPELGVAA